MALEVLAVVTNVGKQRMARQLAFGTSFKIDVFSAGGDGHDPSNPSVALTPQPDQTSLTGPLGDERVKKFIDPSQVSFDSDTCPVFDIVVEKTDQPGDYSSYRLIGRIVYVDPDDPSPPAIGQEFLFAVANTPLKVKTDLDEFTVRMRIQL